MSWLKKKRSPIEQRIEELNRKIAALEAEARRKAATQPAPEEGGENGQDASPTKSPSSRSSPSKPRFRTTVSPGGDVHGIEPHEVDFFAQRKKPVDFSEPGHAADGRKKSEKQSAASHSPPAGPGLLEAILSLFRAPPPRQDKDRLSLLTTGSFQRLKPLKYERRVVRNRLIALIIIVLMILFLVVKCIR